jgi:hypothetical protein
MLIRPDKTMWFTHLFPACRYLLAAGLLLPFAFTPCAGQVTEQDSLFRHISREMSAGFSCHFAYAQGSSAISSGLGDNVRELEQLDTFISLAISHPNLYISRIRLTGYCSIEGAYARNEALAYERVEGFYTYLRDHYPPDLPLSSRPGLGRGRLGRDRHSGGTDPPGGAHHCGQGRGSELGRD